jgi:hypothetical protein
MSLPAMSNLLPHEIAQSECCFACKKSVRGGRVQEWAVAGDPFCAHPLCLQIISDTQEQLQERLSRLDARQYTSAYMAAVNSVNKELGGESMKSFIKKWGPDALEYLFNTVGLRAVDVRSSL